MAFTEDFSDFFDADDFAVPITIALTSVDAIFDNEYVEVNGIESKRPIIQFETAKKSDAAQGDAVVVNSVNYVIEVIEPDGLGLTSAILRTT